MKSILKRERKGVGVDSYILLQVIEDPATLFHKPCIWVASAGERLAIEAWGCEFNPRPTVEAENQLLKVVL